MYYYPKRYKDIFSKTFKNFANNLVLELDDAILNHTISIEDVYNMFINSKLVQDEILWRINLKKVIVYII